MLYVYYAVMTLFALALYWYVTHEDKKERNHPHTSRKNHSPT